jgi:hypothetical protein
MAINSQPINGSEMFPASRMPIRKPRESQKRGMSTNNNEKP